MDKILGIIPIRKTSDRHENDLEDDDFMYLTRKKIWLVSWKARRGEYSSDIERTSMAFLDVKDAKKHIEKLEYAKKILRYKEDLEIRLEEQEY